MPFFIFFSRFFKIKQRFQTSKIAVFSVLKKFFLLIVNFKIVPPTLFTRDLKISPESWLHPRSSFLEKSRRIDRGVYKKIEDICGLEPHMRRLAPSACLLLSYVCPHCSYHISLLTSFFFLLNFLGVLPCLRLWHSAHKLIRLSSSSPRSGCSFSSKI